MNCDPLRGLPNLPNYDAGQRRARLFQTAEERFATPRVQHVPVPPAPKVAKRK
jgi:hypothetical protein